MSFLNHNVEVHKIVDCVDVMVVSTIDVDCLDDITGSQNHEIMQIFRSSQFHNCESQNHINPEHHEVSTTMSRNHEITNCTYRGGTAWGLQNCDSKMDSILGPHYRPGSLERWVAKTQGPAGWPAQSHAAESQRSKECNQAQEPFGQGAAQISEGESFQFTVRAIFCANSATFNPILLIVRFFVSPLDVCTLMYQAWDT